MCDRPCKINNLCLECRRTNKLFDEVIVVGERSGSLGRLIGDYKYHSEVASCRPIAQLVYNRFRQCGASGSAIIPIPTIPKHIRERGFDHMLLVAKELSKLSGIKVNTKLLTRADNTSQHTLSASERRKMIKKSLVLKTPPLLGEVLNNSEAKGSRNVKNAHLPKPTRWLRHLPALGGRVSIPNTAILLDDIWTTGSTLKTAATLLRSIGVKHIIAIAILKQPDNK